jgi:hypothetical protein
MKLLRPFATASFLLLASWTLGTAAPAGLAGEPGAVASAVT